MERWRLITGPAASGAVNMATDEAILSEAREGAAPVLRLYGWAEPTLSLGYRQEAGRLGELGIPVVRRVTGGRAVLHDMELTYSIVAASRSPLFSGGITGAYAAISRSIVAALRGAGVPAEFAPAKRSPTPAQDQSGACFLAPSRHEVVAGGRKLVGSSQRRFRDFFLQHGSILMDVDLDLSARVFGPELAGRMTWVGAHSSVTVDELATLLAASMAGGFGAELVPSTLTSEEEAARDLLLEEKYSGREWSRAPAGGAGCVEGTTA